MNILGIIIDKRLRNTIFISMALHLFCFSCFTFTFADRINYSMDLPIIFLGAILEKSDISIDLKKTENYFNFDFIDGFLLDKSYGSKIQKYHLVASKPDYVSRNFLADKKPFTKFTRLIREFSLKEKEELEDIDEIERLPDWEKDLKLKIE